MKLLSTLMKLRENLLIRDPFVFKRLTDKSSSAVYHTVDATGKIKVFVSNPVSVWLNRYVFVKFSLPVFDSNNLNYAHAYAVVGKHGNCRFIPFMCISEKKNGLDLLALKPQAIQNYMENYHNMANIMGIFH